MKKIYLFLIGSAMMASSVTSAPPGHAFPDKALENYDIRSDKPKDGTGALAPYREKAAAATDAQTLAAARHLLSTGQRDLPATP
jgi:hypothetical protein